MARGIIMNMRYVMNVCALFGESYHYRLLNPKEKEYVNIKTTKKSIKYMPFSVSYSEME